MILWDLAGGQKLARLSAHNDRVMSVAFSPDGLSLASAGLDHNVILWDVAARQPRATLASHLDIVSCVAFSPDSRLVASASWDGTVILWQASDGACLASLEDFGCWVHSVAFAPDGRTVAAGDIHGNVKLWDLSTGRSTTTIPAHVEGMAEPLKPAVALAYSPRGDMLATGSSLGVLKLWDVSAGKPMLTFPGHAGSVLSAAFTSDAKTLASRDERGTVRLWNLSTGRCIRAIAGAEVIAGAPSTAPAIDWDNPDLADVQQSLACSPGGDLLASVDADGKTILLQRIATGEQAGRLAGHTDQVLSLAFAPDGKALATGGKDGQIRLWDTSSLHFIRAIDAAEPAGAVTCVTFSHDGRMLAAVSGGTIRLIVPSSGEVLATFRGHIDKVRSLAFSPNNRTLASAGNDGVMLWDVRSGNLAGVLEGEAGPTYCLAFSPDGGTLACSDHNRTIRLWQIPSGRCIATLQTGDRLAWSLAFSPDGRMLACGGGGDSLRLFNLAYYDRHVLGNYPFYLELARRSAEQLKINRRDVDRWARNWAGETELPLWTPTTDVAITKDNSVDPKVIADWGQLSRHRLLSALRSLGHKPLQTHLPVQGAMDPPTASVIFRPAVGDTRVHTLLGSGISPERARSAQYQQQKARGIRPAAATQPAVAAPNGGTPPA